MPYVEMFRPNRIIQEQRQQLVQAYENEGEDYLLVVDILGVNRPTVRGIVARWIREERIHTELSNKVRRPFHVSNKGS